MPQGRKVDQPTLRDPSYILQIPSLHVRKMNRTFQWVSKDARPDLITLKDACSDICRICFDTGISNLVIYGLQLQLYLLFIHF